MCDAKTITTPEELLREWRDARLEWFEQTGPEMMENAASDRGMVLRRLGNAEHALMDYARTL